MRFEKKDIALLIPATLLAIAGLGPDDAWVVGPCLFLSWIAFIVICAIHEGQPRTRIIVGIVITLALFGVGYRRFNSIYHEPKKESQNTANREHPPSVAPLQEPSKPPGENGTTDASRTPTNAASKKNLEAIEKKRIAEGVPPALAHYDVAKERLASDPEKLSLYDLYLTDFEQSEVKHSRTLVIKTTPEIRMEAAVVQQIEMGTEFVMFYVPYNKGTDQLCLYLRGEQVTAKSLVFSKRIFIYHEAYLTPEQTIFVRNFYLEQGITVSFRSTDYLENRKLQAQVKKLEKHKSP